MEFFAKIVKGFQSSIFILDVRLGSEYASALNMITEILLVKVNKRNKTLSSVPSVDLQKIYSKCLI